MANILLLHHAQGLTEGVKVFAQDLRDAGHTVTTPDFYSGLTFPTVEEGVAHAKSLGDGVTAAADAAAAALPDELVYAGFSLGAMEAQRLGQQRPGARAILLFHGMIPHHYFGDPWPAGVPLQVHIMRNDPWEELSEIEQSVAAAGGELFVYDGDKHLYTDSSNVAEYQADAAALTLKRSLAFLAALD